MTPGYYLFFFAIVWCCGGFALLDSSLKDLKRIKKNNIFGNIWSFIFKFACASYFLGMHWFTVGHDYFVNNERISAGGLDIQQGAFAIIYGLILFIIIKIKIFNKIFNKIFIKLMVYLGKNKTFQKLIKKLPKSKEEKVDYIYDRSPSLGANLADGIVYVLQMIFMLIFLLIVLFLIVKLIKFIWYL